ncbi:hypothetical protein [Gulosibacter molinativorax]|uniref:Uncharacterized protein n=1 Tax=Gulosibacter molinativorax TaxID=256821 RepID=A0ABT7CE53_9MICO|nr:hypothetical protein [Gulosibacter molinativorax]MDJ1372661.1 hypothetical protein [Gulosibacter molinativorax]QUY62397.1 Hypotetical protein [Gulosibacter molinativorax]
MTTTSNHSTADRIRALQRHQAQLIRRNVEAAASNGQPIDNTTARLIAARITPDRNSALARFSAGDDSTRMAALNELEYDDLELARSPVPWVVALWEYLLDDSPAPDHSNEPAERSQ